MSNESEDVGRFKKIIRRQARKDLSKYLSGQDMIISRDGKKISIPMPQIDIPRFRFGNRQTGGVGQGDGNEGDPLSPEEGDDAGQAGDKEGEHAQEVEFSLEEFIDWIGEELELPDLREKGKKNLIHIKDRYTGIRKVGPQGLRHPRRTLKQALKRVISSGKYNPKNPKIIPVRADYRYRAPKSVFEEQAQAVIIYMIDVSGSMGDEQKYIARLISFWVDLWIARNFKGLERRYIIHDAKAKEVDRETFFTTNQSGGTKISSAYKMCAEMIESEYPVSDWNIYPFHFSDGDNLGSGDDDECKKILEKRVFPVINKFFYGQITSPHGSGKFLGTLESYFWFNLEGDLGDKLKTTTLNSPDDVMQAMKELLGKDTP